MITVSDPNHARVLSRIIAIEPDADFSPVSQSPFNNFAEPVDGIERHAKNAYAEQCHTLRHPGTNSTLAEPAAAVGRVQLGKLDSFVNRRREIANRLDEGLGDLPGVRLQPRLEAVESSHHLYTFFIAQEAGINRDVLARRLDADGIQIQLRYFPTHLLPEWRRLGHGLGECPVAERIWFHEQMNLPIYPQLEDWQVDFMVDSVRVAWTELRR
jgi:perosamine synthetase